jgi:uncharacterized protein
MERVPTSMVVIQPTGFCNIDCSYCYLPNRNDKHTISLDIVERLFAQLFGMNRTAPEVTVVWHAGEPLVVPPSFYRDAFAIIEGHRPVDVRVKHSFQTNGMLINEEWCALFKEWNVGVGVSIDGPAELHDANRKTRSGKGTHAQAMKGVATLRAHDVPFHVITVLSAASLQSPERLLSFYLDAGIDHVCFNIEESEGSHVSSLFETRGLSDVYAQFLRRFWHLAQESGRIHFVREIDLAIGRIFRPEEAEGHNIQVEPFAMLNIGSRGEVSSFSPELLGLENAAYDNFVFGNILVDPLAAIEERCQSSALHRDIKQGVDACESSCAYFSVCGGGAPINKLFENGSFASTDTSYCALTQKVPTDIVIAAFENLAAQAPQASPSFTLEPV